MQHHYVLLARHAMSRIWNSTPTPWPMNSLCFWTRATDKDLAGGTSLEAYWRSFNGFIVQEAAEDDVQVYMPVSSRLRRMSNKILPVKSAATFLCSWTKTLYIGRAILAIRGNVSFRFTLGDLPYSSAPKLCPRSFFLQTREKNLSLASWHDRH